MHTLIASVLQARDETKLFVGEPAELFLISLDRDFIEEFGVVADAHERAAVRQECFAEFLKCELAVRKRAVNVQCALKHGV